MRLHVQQYWNFDHDRVAAHFGGDLVFVAEFCVLDEYQPVAVYRARKQNRKAGHKKYLLLTKQNQQAVVRGMSPKEMEKWRYQDGLYCGECDCVIYSIMRHCPQTCSCGKVMVDGGRDYVRSTGSMLQTTRFVKIDLIVHRVMMGGEWYPLLRGNGLDRAFDRVFKDDVPGQGKS